MGLFTLTADRLILDGSNARKLRDKDSIASMKASILAYGLIQPIAVRPPAAGDRDLGGERHRIFAGGRRYQAISELIFEGALPTDYPIPVISHDEATDTDAGEMSVVENIIRRAMRPVDEFRAFAKLADEGLSAEEIALRFGQSVRFVQGRMALGKLHPDLLEQLDNDKMKLEAAMAYTLEPDPDRQLEIYNNLQGWQRAHGQYIKEAITGPALRSTGLIATFIGEDRYLAAGGKVALDLFEDHSFWISRDLVEKLKAERIEEVKATLLSDGWSFVKTTGQLSCEMWRLTHLEPGEANLSPEDQQRMDEVAAALEPYAEKDSDELTDDQLAECHRLEEEYEGFRSKGRTFSSEQKAASGVLIRDDHSFQIEYGVVEAKALATASSSSSKPEKDPLALSAPTLSELGKAATAALAEAVASNPGRALAMLAAFLELGSTSSYSQDRPGRLEFEQPGTTPGGNSGRKSKRSYADAFEAYAAMDATEIAAELAKLVSTTVDVSQEWLGSNAKMRRAALEAFEVDPTPHFDVDSFFKAARKPIIFAAYKEITGHDLKDGKKADMVTAVVDVARKTGWLPEYLRTSAYKSETPPTAEKKKPRTKKK